MGTGKTVVGKLLARSLNREFVEMDEIIEKNAGQEIVDIFAQKGERYFRELESKLLETISARTGLVVSCGGGLICNDTNLKVLKATGRVFLLRASAATIYGRIRKQNHRPLLNVDNPQERIAELLAKREPYYGQADCEIDTEGVSPEEVAEKIMTFLKNG